MTNSAQARLGPIITLVALIAAVLSLAAPGSAMASAQAGKRTVWVHQLGPYVANMCIKNVTKNNIETCTGRVTAGSERDLQIPYNSGDRVEFIVAVVAGHNAYYFPAERDQNCWAKGTSLSPIGYCRVGSWRPENGWAS
ncbi:MAG TPA: hypothetical protein VJT49_15340 [Amycolatopsis sp.]|uniref:hypothetical protein n=1 Tax=Amycolatopsis sp. TaxID=37632 RepID=UPI002B4923A2|nr:hypothetical protein [Amycolatopsis sp.]HKS46452.1 hypothetical protein [Amycolatopsis sp.]